ncbi:hypothetical protein SCG7086_CO_00060 [Chlamydiales bacterium SCGC AG-110-P3]|nr:hypothetical protein SCG7086_CO_00060 [Chlamydiales bacterium SCGC AG-110-P3]
MGLNVSNSQISKELDLCESDVQMMTTTLREGVVVRQPEPSLGEEVEFDEVYLVAGHKGHPAAVKKGQAGAAKKTQGCPRKRYIREGKTPNIWNDTTRG